MEALAGRLDRIEAAASSPGAKARSRSGCWSGAEGTGVARRGFRMGRWCATHLRAAGLGRGRKAGAGTLSAGGLRRNFGEYLSIHDLRYEGQEGRASFFRQDPLGNRSRRRWPGFRHGVSKMLASVPAAPSVRRSAYRTQFSRVPTYRSYPLRTSSRKFGPPTPRRVNGSYTICSQQKTTSHKMCAVLSGPIEPRIRRRMPVGCRRAAKRPLCQRLGQYGRRSGAIDEAIGARCGDGSCR